MTHEFGNIHAWTNDKLNAVNEYLKAYVKALKNQNFHLTYIDAFAGTGYVNKSFEVDAPSLFDEAKVTTVGEIIDGSARLALKIVPSFHKYIFIEKNEMRCNELKKLKIDFSSLSDRIEIVNADANAYVQKLCTPDWMANGRRGVMFLDPYGLQVSWETIEAIAKTRAIDLWLLFPIGTVNRLLNRNGRIKDGRRKRLNSLFGDESWFDEFFERQPTNTLFDGEDKVTIVKTSSFEKIGDYFTSRLKTVFTDVAPNPLFLTNSNKSTIFLLMFAVGNPTGAPIAIEISKHVLGKKKNGS